MLLEHRKVPPDLMNGKKVLDIGCGQKKIPGAVGLDIRELPGVDIIADLNKKLPIEDEQFQCVHADQVLEHVENLIELVYEVYRILQPGGILLAHVPYFRSAYAHIDPTHVRCFTIHTMDYFVKDTFVYKSNRFRDEAFQKIEVFLDNAYPSTFTRKLFTSWALSNPRKFENSFRANIYPFKEISYLLTK